MKLNSHIEEDALKALWNAMKLLQQAKASHYLLTKMRDLIELAEVELDDSDD
jgi:hypothetical protein